MHDKTIIVVFFMVKLNTGGFAPFGFETFEKRPLLPNPCVKLKF